MRKLFLLILLSVSVSFNTFADEGMWLPNLLKALNEGRMKELGMKMSAEDIYSVNKSSLKDAIVSFGGFCTGEVISYKGLVLTNHHCGFRAIQSHSSVENNYIRDGFWAPDLSKELPNAGLFVTFISRIEDVTQGVLMGTNPQMDEKERQSQISKNIQSVEESLKKEDYQGVMVRSFFEGNQYYAFITETYKDIRLVGAPPSSIGNYGKDSDNWVWPRHTGDFSMFRIYADKNNNPAEYSADNIPFTPKRALNISLSGVEQGDFTMIFGFPGRTQQYLPGVAVEQIMRVNDPVKINIRDHVLAAMDKASAGDEKIQIQYASKRAGVSNAWKKWQGEVLGLTRTHAVAKKSDYEKIFQERVNRRPEFAAYRNILPDFSKAYAEFEPYGRARDIYTEIMSRLELFNIMGQLNSAAVAYQNGGETAYKNRAETVKSYLSGFYKDYSEKVDREMFQALIPVYLQQPAQFISPALNEVLENYDYNISAFASNLFPKEDDNYKLSDFIDMLNQSGEQFSSQAINNPLFVVYGDMVNTYRNQVQTPLLQIQSRIDALQRDYTRAQLDVMKEKKFYPDANSTLRVAYGQVDGYQPRDAIKYTPVSTLEGVLEKYVPGDDEFDLPKKLRDLYAAKDYGVYGNNGQLGINFIASNHTTGGNSGSPVLDAYGNLVGINFDRTWEGTMSDINYDASICRNIMVDIRYVLFVVDKFAGADHLIKEMNIVYPKGKK